MNQTNEYKLTDLDYLIGDHHLQMIKAALPYMDVPEQKAVSLIVKFQELRRTVELFENEEVASMGICSLEGNTGSVKDMLNAIKPYGNPTEQDLIELVGHFIQGATPIEQLKHLLTPEQQSKLDTLEMIMQTMQSL